MNLLHLRPSPAAIFPPSALHRIYLKAKRKKTKTQQLKFHQRADGVVPIASLPYPKSSPTPLLISETSTSLTTEEALERIFLNLHSALAGGIHIEPSTFSSLLELCFRIDPSQRRAAALHRLIPASLLHSSANISSKLIRLYASSGLVEKAHNLFDNLPPSHKTAAFPWNALISGYADIGLHEDAMALYHQMEEEGVEPDRFTFPRVIKACASIGSIPHGESVHRHLVRSGFATEPFALNALVDMYAKCGDIARARRIFDQILDRDPVAWNSMINGYIRHGLFAEAIETCRRMLVGGLELDTVTISSLLAGCASSKCNMGLEIHGWILRRGLLLGVSVANSLITMYSMLGQLDRAKFIFSTMPEKDLVSWNAIISASRRDRRVLSIFRQMEDSGVSPDGITFVSLLSACANLGLVEDGRKKEQKN
ncbi:pentatricopeptide repeat-containing protein At4g25270, chloroplastic-like [Phalaenopsis equestris]|uniref:pentatricopeptide repeat-containing protein At4g25270, chloroplastic-like n=1 Tax=Phalaenopsis equestris TaxID=78828 RepID=UPI0009E25255|nr:pentatricopeptide repeat-containing protein At4g25270, chloroplastic-like [Phalaenopsis equestris]